jgi:cysteine desulfurase/selenocysteine lyase
MRYFDNAATSWPKPRGVRKAVQRCLVRGGGNAGRSGHSKALAAARTVLRTRELLGELLHVADPSRIVLTKNATEALNLALYGLLRPGGRVVTSSMEHNSVMRPLRDLERKGVKLEVVPAGAGGLIDPAAFCAAVTPGTSLAVLTHASNVTGAVTRLAPIGEHCRRVGVPLLADAAQTAGSLPIDVEALGVDFLAFSGHKGLLGPQGTGGLYVRDERALEPLERGGTGSRSDRDEQPEFLPDRYESGTLNAPGIAGLGAGVEYLLRRGLQSVEAHERRLLENFLKALAEEPGITVYGPPGAEERTGVLSLNVAGLSCSQVGSQLEDRFGIATRVGLHCAPIAHRSLGTFPEGTVRFSWGPFTRTRDVQAAVRALRELQPLRSRRR